MWCSNGRIVSDSLRGVSIWIGRGEISSIHSHHRCFHSIRWELTSSCNLFLLSHSTHSICIAPELSPYVFIHCSYLTAGRVIFSDWSLISAYLLISVPFQHWILHHKSTPLVERIDEIRTSTASEKRKDQRWINVSSFIQPFFHFSGFWLNLSWLLFIFHPNLVVSGRRENRVRNQGRYCF